jgi:hypothetical protein
MFKKKEKEINLPHWGDAKNWVIKVIDSCTTTRQIGTARRIMCRWSNQYYNKIDDFIFRQVEIELQIKLDNKWEELRERRYVDKGE